jgi:hypothetical protein
VRSRRSGGHVGSDGTPGVRTTGSGRCQREAREEAREKERSDISEKRREQSTGDRTSNAPESQGNGSPRVWCLKFTPLGRNRRNWIGEPEPGRRALPDFASRSSETCSGQAATGRAGDARQVDVPSTREFLSLHVADGSSGESNRSSTPGCDSTSRTPCSAGRSCTSAGSASGSRHRRNGPLLVREERAACAYEVRPTRCTSPLCCCC